jgi:hypothetical protein
MPGNSFSGPGNVRKRTMGVKKNGWVFDKPEAAVIKGRHNRVNKRKFGMV